MLSLILLGSVAAVVLVPVLQAPLLVSLASSATDLRWRSLAGATLFAVPAELAGVVSPFAARLKMTQVARSGRTVGGLYALSTLGSIAGTFAAGFWLIPSLGNSRLLLLMALLLLLNSELCSPGSLRWPKLAVLVLWAAVATAYANQHPALRSGQLVLDRDTSYQRLLVFDLPVPNRLPVRVLSMGFEEYHSAMLLDAPDELPLDYTRFLRAEYATLRQVFPQVLVLAVSYPSDGAKIQNLVLVALRSPVPVQTEGEQIREYAGHFWRRRIPDDVPPLTDDFAPVELYSARQLTSAEAR